MGTEENSKTLTELPSLVTVCRLDPSSTIPSWVAGPFTSITRTADELSIVCSSERIPAEVNCERDWHCLKFDGPMDFTLTGILESVLKPLADERIPILAIATYDTDYVFIKSENFQQAIRALRESGHTVRLFPRT